MSIRERLIVQNNFTVYDAIEAMDHSRGGPVCYTGPVGRGELVFVAEVPFWASKEAKEKNRNEPNFKDYPVLTPKRRDEALRIQAINNLHH